MQATLTNVNNNSIFNPERKIEFLNDMIQEGNILERTSTSYARIFKKTLKAEDKKKKDLADFTLKELEQVFYGFEANNRNTIESYGRIISSYLNWNVKKGYIRENYLLTFRPTDFEKYLTNDETYMTEAQLRRYEEDCVNYQDAVILRLLFEGVSGKQLSEIRNLKPEHVDREHNRLFLMNEQNHSGRILEVEPYTIDLIEGAQHQKQYMKSNGNMDQTPLNNVRDYTDLVQNDYIVRASITANQSHTKPVDKFVLYRRIETIAKELKIEDLTAKYVQRSGMMHYANKMRKDGELPLSALKDIAERFNIKSYHNLKGFLTYENVSKIYGEG